MKFSITTLFTLLVLITKSQQTDSLDTEKLLTQEISYWSSTSDSVKFISLMKKASIYQSAGFAESALLELERAETYARTKREVSSLNYQKMLNYFLAGRFTSAGLADLKKEDAVELDKTKEYLTMKLFSLNESQKWENCKVELLNSCTPADSAERFKIMQLPTSYNYISAEDCRHLSSFLPGLGQTKAGYPLKGLSSFIIQSGLVVFIVYNMAGGFVLTGIVSGVFPLLKFYHGGEQLSAILAQKHNDKAIKQLKSSYLKEIKLVMQN